MHSEYSDELQIPEQVDLLKAKCNTLYQIRIGITAAAFVTFAGIALGYLSTTLRKIQNNELNFPTQKDDITFMTNMTALATLLGPCMFTYSINRLGRKNTILLCLIPMMIQFTLVFFCNSITQLIIAIGIGFIPGLMNPIIVGIYIAEIISPHLRGSLNAFIFTFHTLGSFLGLYVNWNLTIKQSSVIFFIGSVILGLCSLTLPETPHFYIRKGCISEAKTVLHRLYEKDVAGLELSRLQNHIKNEKLSRLRDVFTRKKNLKSLFIIEILYYIKHFSGIVVIYWHSPILLSMGTYKYLSPLSCELIIYLCCFILGLNSSIVFHCVSRRVIGLISMAGVVISLIFLVTYFYLLKYYPDFIFVNDFLPFSLILMLKCSAVFGVLPLSFGYFREVIPVKLIAYFSLCTDFSAPIFNCFVIMIFNYLRQTFDYYVAFGFFLSCALIGTVLFFVFIPETRNKTLEAVQSEI